jgi:hypothetical protein
MATTQLTSRIGMGDASAFLKVTDRAMPVTTIAQSLVVSRRFRQILL